VLFRSDAFDTVVSCLEVAIPVVELTELNRSRIAEKLDRGYLDATTLMEYLISRGMPQRVAHSLVGRIVREALDRQGRLVDLPLEVFRAAVPSLDANVYGVLGVQNAIQAFHSFGSTAPEQVREQIECWKQRLASSLKD